MLNNILKIEEPSEAVISNPQNVTSLHILFIISLLTVDFFSLFSFGIDLKYFKYIINYQELLIINLSIVSIFSLLVIISKKIPYLFALSFSFIISLVSMTYYETGIAEAAKNAILFGFIFSIIINGNNSLYIFMRDNMIKSIKKKVTSIIAFLISGFLVSLAIYNHYVNINNPWEKVYFKGENLSFEKIDSILNIIEPKMFNTSRLEKTQDDVIFVNSKLYINELKRDIELIDNKLIVNNNKFIKHFDNNDYKTFFILNKKNNAVADLIMIFSKKDKNKEEYQITYIQKKELLIL